jgi:hypothetical protein
LQSRELSPGLEQERGARIGFRRKRNEAIQGGKPARTSWARGDVQFIGRGVPHESKNTGGKPVDYVIVAIR